ncbi:TOPRIM nucleotidyl transferase/hydrolase domain-containing protein [Paenarthrobacter sp. NCHU4564]|uniref:TOPRIM nucleotidyl transferase/hydrolase domain-containing protein n=1 Tax=Paenarthrobacter sp. NCHU4564 TaxID=3451353 RepID=UPI003F9C9A85
MQPTTVLVEGESDRAAVRALALRRGHDLAALGVSIVPMGGATSIIHFLDRYGPRGEGRRLLGLCDARESPGIARALARAGIGPGDLEELGFHVCHVDLEDELIRALGVDGVLDVIDEQGELASFRLLQNQPSLREKTVPAQLRRFFGGRSGNKIRYAPLLVNALPEGQAPPPLELLVASFAAATQATRDGGAGLCGECRRRGSTAKAWGCRR